ncbi:MULTISPECIES: ATP-binding protein [Aeromonas]|uniref:ATP-binding protein n=1 Tax=Aeromonas TaxID=642 RepID=UPI00244496F8|nr:ATP-binding protein [Aeromonas dhakensis]HDZ8844512.1 ATP-binding protein [Aeromonas dhakensis]
MAVIPQFRFKTHNGQEKAVDLILPIATVPNSLYTTTIVTGQNGSQKSTLLRELASSLISSPDAWSPVKNEIRYSNVLCISGSTADRFPQKEESGGRRSKFDVPYYTYVGQRIYSNLLSKRAPLETILCFALDPDKRNRFRWRFFSEAHDIAGVNSNVQCTLSFKHTSNGKNIDVLGDIQAITKDDNYRSSKRPLVSYAMAQWLLDEFTYEEFNALTAILKKEISIKRQSISLKLSAEGPTCSQVDLNVLRLGLLIGLFSLRDFLVHSRGTGQKFSVLELSSGEFSMYSTILAVGFGIEKTGVILIDEPENNLHPQWQRDLMEAIFNVCSEVLENSHIIISTHSPLIVGAARPGSFIVDMTNEHPSTQVVSYGASADELLLAQFGVGSSRNKVVVDTVQKAVAMVESGNFESAEFRQQIPQLKRIRDSLSADDPMIDVIEALLE